MNRQILAATAAQSLRNRTLVSLIAFTALSSNTALAVDALERAALIDLYNSTNGDTWTDNSNWRLGTGAFNAPGTECTWHGVHCWVGADVNYIGLFDNNLVGTMPVLVGLQHLFKINVGTNQLSGSMPDLSYAPQLQEFTASNNQLSGTISSSLSSSLEIQVFNVHGNNLTGDIPDLSQLAELTNFDVGDNSLTGSFPTALTTLTHLQSIDVSQNADLTGDIPQDLGSLTDLTHFVASDDNLTGLLPDLGGLTNLQIFNVEGNQIAGTIVGIEALSQLLLFDVGHNQIGGPIPDLSALQSLNSFLAYDNKLTGPIPDLSQLLALQRFQVQYNELGGMLTAGPPPNANPGDSALCPNALSLSGNNLLNAAWNLVTMGSTAIPWWGPAGAGCDRIFTNTLEP